MNYFDTAIKILKKIESLGYDAYIVGGAVRDYLLNLEVYDIDLTTNMPLSEINKNFQTIENGKEYLSITIVESGFKYEITHFRTDLEYINLGEWMSKVGELESKTGKVYSNITPIMPM